MMNLRKSCTDRRLPGLFMAVGGLILLGGCGKSSEPPKVETVEGKVSQIDAKSGLVKMLWYSPKQKQERELEGMLAPEAEILINGRTAQLTEVVVGDKVRVVGYVEKQDGEPRLFASKVEITRPEPISTEGAATPTGASTAPAE